MVVLTLSLAVSAQKTYKFMGWKITKDVPLNELKINLPLAIFGSYPEISYERVLNTDISVGAALGATLDKKRYPYTFMFMPHVRWFFGGHNKSMKQAGTGFFIEANLAAYTLPQYWATMPDAGRGAEEYPSKESNAGVGIGLAAGWKFLSKHNWVGELFVGAGRNFVSNDDGHDAYPRVGLSIGRRF